MPNHLQYPLRRLAILAFGVIGKVREDFLGFGEAAVHFEIAEAEVPHRRQLEGGSFVL